MAQLRVTPLVDKYKEYALGYAYSLHGYLAAWKLPGQDWYVGHIIVDTIGEIPQLAAECIETKEKIDAHETELGREMTMAELCEFLRGLSNDKRNAGT